MVMWLSFLGCNALHLWDEIQGSPAPVLMINTPLPSVSSLDVRRLSDYWVHRIDEASERVLGRCSQGEAVRHLIPMELAVIEVLPGSIRVGGKEVMPLEGWTATKGADGNLLLPLKDAMTRQKKQTHKAEKLACIPYFEGRALFLIHPKTPFGLMKQVLYTLEQSAFEQVDFGVTDPEAVAQAIKNPPRSEFQPRKIEIPEIPEEPEELEAPEIVCGKGKEGTANDQEDKRERLCSDFLFVSLTDEGTIDLAAAPQVGVGFLSFQGIDQLPSVDNELDWRGLQTWIHEHTEGAQGDEW